MPGEAMSTIGHTNSMSTVTCIAPNKNSQLEQEDCAIRIVADQFGLLQVEFDDSWFLQVEVEGALHSPMNGCPTLLSGLIYIASDQQAYISDAACNWHTGIFDC